MIRFRLLSLTLLAVFLYGCDSASLSQHDSDDALVSAAASWFDNASEVKGRSSARVPGVLTGLLDQFYPDWGQGEVVRTDGGRTAVVTPLGDDAALSFDSSGSILRTLIVVIDAEGKPVSGHIVEFASPDEESVSDASTLATGWLSEDFGTAVVLVAEYDVEYAPVRARVFGPGREPLEASITVEECETNSHSRRATTHCYTTYLYSYATCAGDAPDWVCGWTRVYQTTCTSGGYGDPGGEFDDEDGGGGGGGGSGSSGSGDGGDDASDDDGSAIGPTESKESIVQDFVDECSGFDEKDAPDAYERSLADFIGGGLGTGNVERYPGDEGLDGYQSWYHDGAARNPNYISFIFESKLTDTQPFGNPRKYEQARKHIQLLADERDRFFREHPGLSFVGTPIYVVASQNRRGEGWDWPEGEVRPDWQIGSTGTDPDTGAQISYHDELIRLANDLGVAIIHAKVARLDFGPLPDQWTRNLEFQFMNEIQWADHTSNPFLQWLAEQATTADPSKAGVTFTYPANLDLRCQAAQEKASNENRAPPGGVRL